MLHAERSICEGTGPSGADPRLDRAPRRPRLPHAALHHLAEPVLRGVPHRGRRAGRGHDRQRCRPRDLRLGPDAALRSGAAAWPITDGLFARIYASREPFWTDIERGDGRWHVFFSNDRNGIYALGYPALTLFDRFVHLAELTTLAGRGLRARAARHGAVHAVARERPRVGRALLREIRASFYRKLFLAFVLASIIPVLTLALVIRAYFAGLLRADVEAEAARTAVGRAARHRGVAGAAAQRRRGRCRRPATT